MIAGEIVSFIGDNANAEVDEATLIELTDWSNTPYIEIGANVGKRRVYFKFRMSDLVREIKEFSNA